MSLTTVLLMYLNSFVFWANGFDNTLEEEDSMNRRDVLKGAALGAVAAAGSTVAAPAIATGKAMEVNMVST